MPAVKARGRRGLDGRSRQFRRFTSGLLGVS